ncbi:hypothetical protein OS493_017602 [Desmophyllum pertusum]|uniref:GRF-type domain-containing protein n=1 Tax=Desmophyllum pertusum TaxID=174260 RepID=A0A9W9ZP82_9CNID|nr:hypothetical protein OS493_017602 [Desmophyllum pertusum]
MSSKRRPLQALQSMVDQLPAPVQKKKRNGKKTAAILPSSPRIQHDCTQQYQQQQQRAVESILPSTQVDYFPNPYQHMNPWTPAEQDEAIVKYQNGWDRRQEEEEEESVANMLEDLIRDDTLEPQQEPQQVITVQEKKHDFTVCPFHRCKLTTFTAWKSKEVYIKCSVDTCCLFSHMDIVVDYMKTIHQKVHESYVTSGCNLKCDCKEPVTLRVSRSEKNPGRPYFGCQDTTGCRFFQWGDIPLSRKNEAKQKNRDTK